MGELKREKMRVMEGKKNKKRQRKRESRKIKEWRRKRERHRKRGGSVRIKENNTE